MNLQINKPTMHETGIFLYILFSSGFLLLSNDKIAGIPFLRELLILVILVHTTYRLIASKWFLSTQYEYFILGFTIFFILGSSLLANIFWGQPIIYGILEERRTLAYLIFFPVFWALMLNHITIHQIVKFIILGFLFTSFMGYLYYFNIIPDNAAPSFAVNFRGDIDSFDPRAGTRYMLPMPWMTVLFIYSMYKTRDNMAEANKEFYLFLFLATYIVAYLWFVDQTRGTMLWYAIFTLFIFRKNLLILIDKAVIAIPLIIIFMLIFQDFVLLQVEKFQLLLAEATEKTGPRVRDVTKAIIAEDISNNLYFGKGALSLQWHEGFARVFNEHFYLSDVGLMGVYYRFGFLAFLLIPIYYLFIIIKTYKIHKYHTLIKAALVSLLPVLTSLGYGAGMAYAGLHTGVLLAIVAYVSLKKMNQ